MACFNPTSVNTIRCITLKTNSGVIVPYCFMRTGRKGSFVDNGGSGGLLIGIDVTTGITNTDAFDEYGEKYDLHPDSRMRFCGFQIPEWDKMISICKTAAEIDKDMGFLSWDMAYSEKGWCVIEVNEIGQFIGPQIVYGKGINEELNRYLLMMKKFI